MDSRAGCLLNKPIIMSRGFVYMQDSKEMIREAELLVSRELSHLLKRKTTFGEIKNTIRDTLAPYFYQKTKRKDVYKRQNQNLKHPAYLYALNVKLLLVN